MRLAKDKPETEHAMQVVLLDPVSYSGAIKDSPRRPAGMTCSCLGTHTSSSYTVFRDEYLQ